QRALSLLCALRIQRKGQQADHHALVGLGRMPRNRQRMIAVMPRSMSATERSTLWIVDLKAIQEAPASSMKRARHERRRPAARDGRPMIRQAFAVAVGLERSNSTCQTVRVHPRLCPRNGVQTELTDTRRTTPTRL